MKKSNVKYLKEYEADMITALFYDYTRQIPISALTEINRIYTEETGKILNTNYSCSNCVLKLLKQTAIFYFKENIDSLPENLKIRYIERYNKDGYTG